MTQTAPRTQQQPRRSRPTAPLHQVERIPMASVIGRDIEVGDRVGSEDLWLVTKVGPDEPGTCAGTVHDAIAGRCACYREGDPQRLPRRTVFDAKGGRHTVFLHLRYAIAQR